MIDTNQDGQISAQEIIDIFEKYSVNKHEILKLKKLLIKNGKEDTTPAFGPSKFRQYIMPITITPDDRQRIDYDEGHYDRNAKPREVIEDKEAELLHCLSWLEQLCHILTTHLSLLAAHRHIRYQY